MIRRVLSRRIKGPFQGVLLLAFNSIAYLASPSPSHDRHGTAIVAADGDNYTEICVVRNDFFWSDASKNSQLMQHCAMIEQYLPTVANILTNCNPTLCPTWPSDLLTIDQPLRKHF